MEDINYIDLKPIGYIGIVDYINELRELESWYDITEFLNTCDEILKVGFWLDLDGWKDLLGQLQENLEHVNDNEVLPNLVMLKRYIIMEYIKRISTLLNTTDLHISQVVDMIFIDNSLVFVYKDKKVAVN